MKRTYRYVRQIALLLSLAGMSLLSACQRETSSAEKQFRKEKEVTILEATLEDDVDTKTQRIDGKTYWTPGDAISVFYGQGTGGGSQFVAVTDVPARRSDFSGTISVVEGGDEDSGSEVDYFWAAYPYDGAMVCDGETVTMTMPAVQQATVAGSFAEGSALSLARSLGLKLSFKNIYTGFGFYVNESGCTAVRFRGNNNEVLAGRAKVGFDGDGNPVVTEILDGVTEVTLLAPEGGFETGSDKMYYMPFFPKTLSGGFTVTLVKPTQVGTFVYSKSINLKRNKFQPVNNLDTRAETTWSEPAMIVVPAGGGIITLPNTTDAVTLDFSGVTDGLDYDIVYNAGGLKPATIYCMGTASTHVGTLSGNLPESTVELLSGTYDATSLTTALSTLKIKLGVTVGTVNVKGGSVTVDGQVTSLSIQDDANRDDDEQLVVEINNTVVNVDCKETNCTIYVAPTGEVSVIDTQSQTTTVAGTVENLTAGESAQNVTVADGGTVTDVTANNSAGSVTVSAGATVTGSVESKAATTTVAGTVEGDVKATNTTGTVTVTDGATVTGSVDTQAATTTVEGGATVGSVDASGSGSVDVQAGATVDAVSSTGDVSVTVDPGATTSSEKPIPTLSVKFGEESSPQAIPLGQEAYSNLCVRVNTNMPNWICAIPAGSSWVSLTTGQSSVSSSEASQGKFYINVSANASSLGRKASLKFEYWDDATDKTKTDIVLPQYGSGGIGGSIDPWGDGGTGDFHKN